MTRCRRTIWSHPRAVRLRAMLAKQLGLAESEVRRISTTGCAGRRCYSASKNADGPRPPAVRRSCSAILELVSSANSKRPHESAVEAGAHGRAGAQRKVNPWRWRALLWLAVAMPVVAPFAWILARRARAADRAVRERGRTARARPEGAAAGARGGLRELAHAAAAFNEMQARLSRYVDDRTTFMAAIAHDLRTPLMRPRLRARRRRTGCARCVRARHPRYGAYDRVGDGVPATWGQRPRRRLDLRALAESVSHHFIDLGAKSSSRMARSSSRRCRGAEIAVVNLIGNAVQICRSGARAPARGRRSCDRCV